MQQRIHRGLHKTRFESTVAMNHPQEMYSFANKENHQQQRNPPRNIQDRYESFSQYHTLWKMLLKDKSVLEEIDSFPVLKIPNKSHEESFVQSPKQAEKIDKWNPIMSPPSERNTNDFMTAIAKKESITFQVDKCCGMIGCEGCIDPIVEIVEEKEEESFHQEEKWMDPIHPSDSLKKLHFEKVRTMHNDSSREEDNDKSQTSSSSSSSSSGGSTIVAFDISNLGVDDGDRTTSTNTSKNQNESDLGLDISQITISPSLHENSIPTPCKSPLEYRDDSSSEVEWNDEEDFNSQDDDSIAHENTIIILDDESDYESEYDSTSLIEEASIENKPQTPSKQNQRHFKQNRDAITLAAKNWFDKIVFKGALESVTVTYVPRLTSTAGMTRLKTSTYKGIQSRSASIELSAKLIDDEHRLRSTLMHELCHAAAFLVDGVTKPPHGSCFKKWAKIAMTLIPEITVSTTHSYVTNSHKYAWACTNSDCRIIIKRYSNSVNVDRHVCGKCKSKLIEIEVNSKDPSVIVPKKKREASGFSLYVQQNSSLVRARLEAESDGGKIEQKEVMKELGIMWRRSKDKTIDNV